MSSPEPKADLRLAASVLLLRDAPQMQVLMVRRHHQVDFASGALVFPGGKPQPGDDDPAWAGHALGWADLEPAQRALRIAAIREAFEEAGVLLAERRDGSPVADACDLAVRQAVDAGRRAFIDVVRELDVRLRLQALTVFSRWITPIGFSKRFDTWFYVAQAPADQLAACDGRETVDAEWVAPDEALRLRAAGARRVVFPTRMNLGLLAEAASSADAVARAATRPLNPVLPTLQQRPEGAVLVLSPDAGFGAVAEPLD